MKKYQIVSFFMAIVYCSFSLAATTAEPPTQKLQLPDVACPIGATPDSIQQKILDRQTLFLTPANGFAASTVSAVSGTTPTDPVILTLMGQLEKCKAEEVQVKKDITDIAGLKFGIGLAFMNLKANSITDAQIIDGVIRVKKDQSNSVGLLLESHYLVHISKWNTKIDSDIGIGPFAAVRVVNSTDAKLSFTGYGLGLMTGFNRYAKGSTAAATPTYWNIGLGYFVDTQVKELGSGMVEGQALPGTETAIRYREVSKGGWMAVLSSTF